MKPRASAAAAIEADFSHLLTEPALVLAVSGGGDSMALMRLVSDAHQKHNSASRLVVATVDHRLRAESTAEARAVAASAADLGIEHRTLVWSGAKPAHGIQAAARKARLELLADLAQQIGASVVLTGHTGDDLAETVLMRAERGEGIGLAGIAPATLFRNSVWFVRPLLAQRRAALRALLVEQGASWIDDPSNENERFERVRTRRRLAEGETGKRLFDEAISTADRAARERISLGVRAAELIDRFARLKDGAIRCDSALVDVEDRPAGLHALRLLVAVAGNAEHLPDEARSSALMEELRAGRDGTLANGRLVPTADGFRIERDRRGRAGPLAPFRTVFSELLPSFDLAAARSIAKLLGNDLPSVMPGT